jgi:hypothetical protein
MLTFSGSAGEAPVFNFCLPSKGSIAEDIVKYRIVTLERPFIIFLAVNPNQATVLLMNVRSAKH